MIRSQANASRAPATPLRAPVTRPPARRTRQLSGTGTRLSHPQTRATMTAQTHIEPLRSPADAGKAAHCLSDALIGYEWPQRTRVHPYARQVHLSQRATILVYDVDPQAV